MNIEPKDYPYMVNGIETLGREITYGQIVDAITAELERIGEQAQTSLEIVQDLDVDELFGVFGPGSEGHETIEMSRKIADFVKNVSSLEELIEADPSEILEDMVAFNPEMLVMFSSMFDKRFFDFYTMIFVILWNHVRRIALSRVGTD